MSSGSPSKTGRALIVDPDLGFLESLARDPGAETNRPILAANGAQAQSALAELSVEISGIFVNPRVARPNGLSVIRCAHQLRPGTPIFLLDDRRGWDDESFSPVDLDRLAVHETVSKPVSLEALTALVAPLVQGFDADGALASGKRGSERVGEEMCVQESEFMPILARNFLCGRKSFFDLYIRIGSGRFVKLLEAGDVFPIERLTSYLSKGVITFYLRREAQLAYLSYCDHLTKVMIEHRSAPAQVKLNQTLNLGEETLRFLKDRGVDEGRVGYAKEYVDTIGSLLAAMRRAEIPELSEFMADLRAYDRGASTALIAVLIAQASGLDSGRFRKVVGLAAVLHDIGMQGLLTKDADEAHDDPESLDTVDQIAFETHPTRGADILRKSEEIEPAVVQAVAQHHERRSGKGFPAGLGPGRISRVAEIVGIADDFVRLIRLAGLNQGHDPLWEMERRYFDGYSYPVIEAFRRAFLGGR